jgi:hypothetical protein
MTPSSDALPLQPPSAMSDVLLPSCTEDLLGVRQDRMRHVLGEHCCKAGFPSGLSTDIPVPIDMVKVNAALIRAACARSISGHPRVEPEQKISAVDLRTPVKRVFRGLTSRLRSALISIWTPKQTPKSQPRPRHSMWMPDMKFPLDIVWLDETLSVINISYDCAPCPSTDECPSISSVWPCKYAIEMNAGETEGPQSIEREHDARPYAQQCVLPPKHHHPSHWQLH